IGIVDLTISTFAMYVLLPSDPSTEFTTVAVAFVSAMLLGLASHSPSGLGVFDATMMVALDRVDKAPLLAALLLFRLLYYVAPLAVAFVFLGARESIGSIKASAMDSRTDAKESHGAKLAIRNHLKEEDSPKRTPFSL